jgi:hypothetical protein
VRVMGVDSQLPSMYCIHNLSDATTIGSTRAVLDGSGAAVRYYVPFGEQIPAGVGSRMNFVSASEGTAAQYRSYEP